MDFWLILISILCIGASIFSLWINSKGTSKNLPPSPPTLPIVGNFLLLLKSSNNFSSLKPLLRQLSSKYGPIITLYLGSRPSIFITSRETAHQALVRSGSTFASRPPAMETSRIIFTNQNTVATSPYNPIWRVLRHNFMSLTHPSRLHLYSDCRRWAAKVLIEKIAASTTIGSGDGKKAIHIVDHFQHAFFCLLTYMCFGEKLDEKLLVDIERTQRATIGNFIRFNVLNFMPKLTRILFRNLWIELLEIRQGLDVTLLPLIKSRQERSKERGSGVVVLDPPKWYLDTILELQVPGEGRKFTDFELVSLCSEFLNSGTDTTVTTLQWVMANLVKHQRIQKMLQREIDSVVQPGDEIQEEDLKEMPYLKAVILETLRRHPPGHFILPRAVTEDTKLGGYDIPKTAIINVTVAEMGRDPQVWEDPMEFKPERFLGDGVDGKTEEFDFKGVKGIKMMPFGAGRRVCPAITVAILHLEWFVANLVREFEWRAEEGVEVDLSEKQDFTTGMRNPLKVVVTPRIS
ncbi:unnamed protein product [Linum tenue]|uniref:Cytochrome P450 n=1 Tax=Linum tenue TaxID=586396 RepID=A0AAV0LDB0_9ROSI|nr:unnamed protein product [Linum tenue]